MKDYIVDIVAVALWATSSISAYLLAELVFAIRDRRKGGRKE